MYVTDVNEVGTPITHYVTANDTMLVKTDGVKPYKIVNNRLLTEDDYVVEKVIATSLWGSKEVQYKIKFKEVE
jgi:hypothetical protein